MGIADIAAEQTQERLDPSGNNGRRIIQQSRASALESVQDVTNRAGTLSMEFGNFGKGPAVRMEMSVEEMLQAIFLGVVVADALLFLILLGVM